MKIGVSTACLYPMETETALETLGRLGITTAEVFINSPSEVEPKLLAKLCAIREHYGIEVAALHPCTAPFEPYMLFTNYQRRFQDGMRGAERYYEAACRLGAPLVILHGDRKEGMLPDQEYYERFGRMARRAASCGVTLVQENVSRCKSRSSGFIMEMRKYLGNDAHFLLDLKQVIRAGETVEQMLDAMGDRIVHLHLSDNLGPSRDCLPPGKGGFDFDALFRRMEGQGYRGVGMIELYRDNYGDPRELADACGWLQERT